jgi:hypothetical protein
LTIASDSISKNLIEEDCVQPIYDESYEVIVQSVEIGQQQEEYRPVKLITSRGLIHCRYYPVNDAEKATIWVGGIGGDWDTPAHGLYPLLCEALRKEGIASLRVHYRYPTKLEEALFDVLAGITYMLCMMRASKNLP